MNQKNSLLLTFAIAALMVFAPHRASAACGSLPNVFVNGVSTVDASTTNANNNFMTACAKNVDNTQIGAAGIFASQIIPTTGAQATFGGGQTYTFPAAVTTGGLLTVPSGGATITGTVAVTGAITATTSISAGNATAAALTAGDLGASRGASSGAVIIGGSSSSMTLDYGVTTATVLTSNTRFNDTGAISAGSGTQATLTAGDLGASRTASTGSVSIGGSSSSATLDYGVTTGNALTNNTAFNNTNSISAGSATAAALTAGDVGASRSTTTGALKLGGSGSSAVLDYGVTTATTASINTVLQSSNPVTAGSITAGPIPAWYSLAGAAGGNTVHITFGTCSTVSVTNCTVTLTNNGKYSNLGSWACFGSPQNVGTGAVLTLLTATDQVRATYADGVSRSGAINVACIGQ